MKVLAITPTMFPAKGGIEQVVLELAVRVRSAGVEMDIAHVAPRLTFQTDIIRGIPIHRIPLYGHRLIGVAPKLAKLAQSFDLLHVHDPQVMALTANVRWLCSSKPAVLSTHGGFWHTKKYRSLKTLYQRLLLRFCLMTYSRILASSTADFQYYAQYTDRLFLCANGVHVRPFNVVRGGPDRSLLRWIYWGRLSRNKRIDLVIECVATARRLGHDVSLLICGQDFDGLLTDLRSQVNRLGLEEAVSFSDFMDDGALKVELANRGVYITASEHEGFGLSVVEAMAAGLVVVCRDMSPLNSFVANKVSGWFLSFDGCQNDKDSISSLLSQSSTSAAALSESARAAVNVYDWELAADRFVLHYKDAV